MLKLFYKKPWCWSLWFRSVTCDVEAKFVCMFCLWEILYYYEDSNLNKVSLLSPFDSLIHVFKTSTRRLNAPSCTKVYAANNLQVSGEIAVSRLFFFFFSCGVLFVFSHELGSLCTVGTSNCLFSINTVLINKWCKL